MPENAARQRRRERRNGESRKVMVGWSHLLLAAHRSSSFRVGPGAFGGREAARAAKRGPPEFPR